MAVNRAVFDHPDLAIALDNLRLDFADRDWALAFEDTRRFGSLDILLGREPADLVGTAVASIVHPDDADLKAAADIINNGTP